MGAVKPEPSGSDRPGNELPKEYRVVARDLVDNQGWRYRRGHGHPKLYPADPEKAQISVPTTPSDRRALLNFISSVRRAGGIVPH